MAERKTELAYRQLWGLHSDFLAARDNVEQMHIFDLTARAAQTLHRWAARYPLMRRVRVWPLVLSVAAAAPYSTVDALVSTARLSLWVFTLDDLFDEERIPLTDLRRRSARYQAISADQPVAPSRDSMATALQEVRNDLSRYPLFGSLGGEWATALSGTIEGMMREYEWRQSHRSAGARALPSYEDYLATGLYSIGGPPHVWAALITTNDPTTPDHLEHLHCMEQVASTCIRLANDLQSAAKERLEGKINALVLLSHLFQDAGRAPADAYQLAEIRVRADISQGLERLSALQAAAATKTKRPEATIADIARFVCDFYSKHDYHTFTVERGSETGSRAG